MNRQSRFVLPLFLATSAGLAQGVPARAMQSDMDLQPAKVAPVLEPMPGKALAWLVREPLDMVIVLASWRKLTFQVAGADLLADATILKIAAATEARQQIRADLPAGFADDATLFVQAVGLKATPVLSIDAAPVQKVQFRTDAGCGGGIVVDRLPTWTEAEQKALFAEHLERMYACQLIWDLTRGTYGLYAEYTALTGGHALQVAGTELVDGRLQVMLELRIPGPGEVTTDVIETHQLVLELGKEGGAMDVHVAITDGIRHTRFRPYGSFDPQ
jgi:hypothetical protein